MSVLYFKSNQSKFECKASRKKTKLPVMYCMLAAVTATYNCMNKYQFQNSHSDVLQNRCS